MNKHLIAFESDLGSTTPYGWGFSGGANGLAIVKDISEKYLKQINCTVVVNNDGGGADTAPLSS